MRYIEKWEKKIIEIFKELLTQPYGAPRGGKPNISMPIKMPENSIKYCLRDKN